MWPRAVGDFARSQVTNDLHGAEVNAHSGLTHLTHQYRFTQGPLPHPRNCFHLTFMDTPLSSSPTGRSPLHLLCYISLTGGHLGLRGSGLAPTNYLAFMPSTPIHFPRSPQASIPGCSEGFCL